MAEAGAEVPPEGDDLESGSAVDLQRSLHTLLEQRGVMQDLRAHLRAHLVSLIRNAQQGKPLACKLLQAQRLELKFQALNILIAEYLLRQEFNFTLSVFSSEIPLASMVFHYAHSLLSKPEHDRVDERFDEEDLRQIMNVLGVPCGTEQARRTAETYRNSPQQPPLLMCILHSLQHLEKDETMKSTGETCSHSSFCEVCRGKRKFESQNKKFAQDLSNYCAINLNHAELNLDNGYQDTSDVERDLIDEMFQEVKTVYESETALLRSTQESHLQQSLASYQAQLLRREKELEVEYEARIEAKERNLEERKGFLWRLARRLRQQHAQLTEAMHKVDVEKRQIQQREDNLKEQLKNAENLLKRNGDEMREQLSQELKVLEQHIEAMKTERDNITQERTELEKFKMTLPNQSDEAKTQFEEQKRKNVDLQRHYDILRDELSIVQKYLVASKSMEHKSLVEASSLTDIYGIHSRLPDEFEVKNHGNSSAYSLETKSSASLPMYDKDAPMNNSTNGRNRSKIQLINDLKKFKNVNFRNDAVVQVNVDASNIATTEVTAATDNKQTSEQTDKMIQELLLQFRDDNLALRNFASQQQEHIRELLSEQGRLRAELTTAQHTVDNMTRLASIAAPVPTSYITTPPYSADRVRTSTPQVFRPVGSVRESVVAATAVQIDPSTRTIAKHAIDEARPSRPGLHRSTPRYSPRITAPRPSSNYSPSRKTNTALPIANTAGQAGGSRLLVSQAALPPQDLAWLAAQKSQEAATFDHQTVSDISERGRILTHKLFRSQEYDDYPQVNLHDSDDAGSPTDEVLAAAKLRLKKLEIEAEVVEQSYLDFRRRHAPCTASALHCTQRLSTTPQHVDYNTPRSVFGKYGQYTARNVNAKDAFKVRSQESDELDKYISDYQNTRNKIRINPNVRKNFFSNPGQTILSNYPSNNNETHSHEHTDIINIDQYNGKLVEKSLTEFRRLYHTNKKLSPSTHIRRALQELRSNEASQTKDRENNIITSVNNSSKPPFTNRRNYNARVVPARKLTEDEQKILKSNIQKIYSMNGAPKTKKVEISEKINITFIEGGVVADSVVQELMSENSIDNTGRNGVLEHPTKNTEEFDVEFYPPQSKPVIEENASDILSIYKSKISPETIMQNAEQTNDEKENFRKNKTNKVLDKNRSLQGPSDEFKDIADLNCDKIITKDSEQNKTQKSHCIIQNVIPETLPRAIIETNSQGNKIIINSIDGGPNNNKASDAGEENEKAAQNIQIVIANKDQENFVDQKNHCITVNIYKAPPVKAVSESISFDSVVAVSNLDETVTPTSIESVVLVQDLTSKSEKSMNDDNEVDHNSEKLFEGNKDNTKLLKLPLTDDIETTVADVRQASSVDLASSKGSPTRTGSYVLAQEMEHENSSDLSADVDNDHGIDSNKSYDSPVSIAKSENEDSFWE